MSTEVDFSTSGIPEWMELEPKTRGQRTNYDSTDHAALCSNPIIVCYTTEGC